MKQLFTVLLWIIGVFVGLLAILILFFPFIHYSGADLVLIEMTTGFWSFLRLNIPAISWNADTWGPGLGAFILASGIAHGFFSRWAAKTGRAWSVGTTACVMMIMPVLFGIAFIVPGILLQWEILRSGPWIDLR